MSEDKDCPKYVSEDTCKARMDALDTKLKYLFGTSLITIVLIIVQILRGG
jgi:hypothetical protein